MEQWARLLIRNGLKFDFEPFEDEELHRIIHRPGLWSRKATLAVRAFGRRFRLLHRLRNYDLIYLFREAAVVGPALVERLMARQRIPIIYDFDDAIWTPYVSPANSYLSYLKFFGKTATLCRLSRVVMVGNEYLAAYARKYNSRVEIVPTTIDTDLYSVPDRTGLESSSDPVTIGWTGSYSTVQHLNTIRSALQKLARQIKFRLLVIGTPDYRIDGVDVVAKPWQADSEVPDLQKFQIGLMPLPADDWSKGKCGLKLLQCMAVGTPVVGSPVGVNQSIIQDGVTGFRAITDDQWVDRLRLLVSDLELRKTMGFHSRKMVEDHYSAFQWAPRVLSIFKSVANLP
jgi:glycosyltransferase involved in cell wall biosynthesis